LRLVLEGFSARLAAERATENQLEAMEALIRRLDETADGDGKALMAIDEQFHELLYQAADNDLLANMLRRLHAQSFRIWHLVLDRISGVRGAMEQHIAITRALQAGDADLAESLVQKHVSEFQQQIKASL